jgi:hypothetical protein
MFLSGNEMYWRVRWEDNYRTMVVYKESQSLTKIDPKLDEWTGTFRDARRINPLGPQPENAVTGQIFTINAWRNDPLVVPGRYARLRQWRSTDIHGLSPDQRAILFRGILGHEMDEDKDNGFRPPGLIHLSRTEVDNCMYIMDHGSVFDSGSATHTLTLYRAQPSGALVFGAGTCQWGWALDDFHDSETLMPPIFANPANIRVGKDPVGPDRTVQQFTVNMLADMGVQPATLNPTLKKATVSADTAPPVCEITSVTVGQTLRSNSREGATAMDEDIVEIHVEARDADEGTFVAGVEVKPGKRDRWHPAVPASEDDTKWSYYVPVRQLEKSLKSLSELQCRATDDSVNTGPAAAFAVSADHPVELLLIARNKKNERV